MSTVSDLIREVVATTSATEPQEIARLVQESIEDRDAALAEMLPTYVRTVLSRVRMLGEPDAFPAYELLSSLPIPAPAVTAAPTVTRASRIRTDWQARLDTPLRVGGAWKRLGDCTADDCRAVAASLRDRAEGLVSKADWYDRLATLLPSGATVATLSADEAVAA